jgi:hypothetical protein
MVRNQNRMWAYVVAALTGPALAAHAEPPRVGETQKLTVISISLQAGSTEKETRQVTYTPPPGWYVRSHFVDCAKKTGNSSFTVTTVPQNWAWSSEEKITESYKHLIELAEKVNDRGLHSKFVLEREQLLSELRKVRSSHHTLVVDATARGEGLFRSGGCLQLTVLAELVYAGTDEALPRARTGRAPGAHR